MSDEYTNEDYYDQPAEWASLTVKLKMSTVISLCLLQVALDEDMAAMIERWAIAESKSHPEEMEKAMKEISDE